MTSGLDRIMAGAVGLLGTWPGFAALALCSGVLFGYLVPRAKAPIFAQTPADLPHKVLDEYFPGYTPAIARAFFAALGPDGRAAYRRFYLTMDFWFPGATAALALASLLLIAYPPPSAWSWLALVALPSWLLDLAENLCHFRMAGSYPRLSPGFLTLAPACTRLKWICAIVPLPVALVGFAIRFVVPGS